jgi:hypothetical protein
MVDVVSKDPAYKFLPGCLSFAEVEPQDGRLNKTDTTLGNTAWWYASSSQGVIWGPGAGNTIATGYWYQTPVNRFIYVGDASKFFTFDGTYTYSELDDYIMGYSEDYQVTGTWTFNDTSKPLVHASKTLHTHPIQSDLNGWLTINSIAPGFVAISLTTDANNTFTLRSSCARITRTSWSDDSTINSGDIIIRPATNNSPSRVQIWDGVLQ